MCNNNSQLELIGNKIEKLRQKLNATAVQEGFKLSQSKTYELSTQLDSLIMQYLKHFKS